MDQSFEEIAAEGTENIDEIIPEPEIEEETTEEQVEEENTDDTDETENVSDDEPKEEEQQEEEVMYDIGGKLYTKEEAAIMFEKAQGAERKFQTAAQLRKEAEYIKQNLKQNFIAEAKKMGVNVDEMIDNYVVKRMEIESLPPEQQKYYQEKEELEQRTRELQQREQAIQQQIFQQQTAQIQEQLTNQFTQALTEAKMPVNQKIISSMAFHAEQDRARGLEINPQRLVEAVKNETTQNTAEFIKTLEITDAIELLGKDFIKKVKDFNIEQIKKPLPKNNANPKVKPKKPGAKVEKQETMTMEQFREQLEREALEA